MLTYVFLTKNFYKNLFQKGITITNVLGDLLIGYHANKLEQLERAIDDFIHKLLKRLDNIFRTRLFENYC